MDARLRKKTGNKNYNNKQTNKKRPTSIRNYQQWKNTTVEQRETKALSMCLEITNFLLVFRGFSDVHAIPGRRLKVKGAQTRLLEVGKGFHCETSVG